MFVNPINTVSVLCINWTISWCNRLGFDDFEGVTWDKFVLHFTFSYVCLNNSFELTG